MPVFFICGFKETQQNTIAAHWEVLLSCSIAHKLPYLCIWFIDKYIFPSESTSTGNIFYRTYNVTYLMIILVQLYYVKVINKQ